MEKNQLLLFTNHDSMESKKELSKNYLKSELVGLLDVKL